MSRFFGELADHPVGSVYADRKEVMYAGLHDNWVPGISGDPAEGCDCIALNLGYADDEDHGDWILYTGAGGRDSRTKRQIENQEISHHHNAALVYSEEAALPIRVVRGPRGERPYAPASGYRYDGLYKVVRHWAERGRDGFRIWRFHLVKLTDDEAFPWTPSGRARVDGDVSWVDALVSDSYDSAVPTGSLVPTRAFGIVQRIVRSTAVATFVKEQNENTCQICGSILDLPVGSYSEGAHIRPVGSPHLGPDTVDNVLCLCPNDHVLFDKGGLYLDDDLTVRDHRGEVVARLKISSGHAINLEHIRYHRSHHGFI